MGPLKLVRNIGKVLRGGGTGRDVFLGVFLGFAVGMTPGFNLTLILFVLLLLFLNTNGPLAMLALVLGKALCLALAPVTFQIGYFLMHTLGLVGVVRSAADTPVAALLDLHVYCLLGALPVIIVVGGLLAAALVAVVGKARRAVAAVSGSDGAAGRVAQSGVVRLVARIAFGKDKRSAATGRSPLIRTGRVVVALVVVGVLVVLQYVYLDRLVAGELERGIGLANGAEVNVARAALSLGAGELALDGLQVTDPAKSTHNSFQAEKIVAKVSVRDLLAKRLVVDLIECRAMRTDVQRAGPGEVYRPKEKSTSEALDVGDLLGKLGGKAAEYAKQIERFNDLLKKLKEHLESEDPAKDPAEEPDKEELQRRAKAEGYLRLSAKDYLVERPTWVIREAKVTRIEITPELPPFTLRATDISSHPSLHDKKMTLEALPDKEALDKFLKDQAGGLLKGVLGGKKDDKDGKSPGGLLDGLLKRK